jgi:hypothetical protein
MSTVSSSRIYVVANLEIQKPRRKVRYAETSRHGTNRATRPRNADRETHRPACRRAGRREVEGFWTESLYFLSHRPRNYIVAYFGIDTDIDRVDAAIYAVGFGMVVGNLVARVAMVVDT